MPVDRRRPRLGYLLAAVAALMFAVNGSIAKFLLDDGVSAVHLSQLGVTLSFALLAGALVLVDRSRLRIARADVARMAWLGIAGLALVQLTYFLAIDRLPISVALVIRRAYREIGVGVVLGVPGSDAAGATYTVDFGVRR